MMRLWDIWAFFFSEDSHVNILLFWHPPAYVGIGCMSQRFKGFKGGGWSVRTQVLRAAYCGKNWAMSLQFL